MKQEIYICDNCKKVLSKDGKGKPHLSINFGFYSGWVENVTDILWRHTKKVDGIKQFCSGQCAKEYFDKLKPVKDKIK